MPTASEPRTRSEWLLHGSGPQGLTEYKVAVRFLAPDCGLPSDQNVKFQ